MLKAIRMMTLAVGLSVALAAGAHAQTLDGFNKSGAQIYTVQVTPAVLPLSTSTQTYYVYDYMLTLKATTPKVNVNTFTFNFDPDLSIIPLPGSGYSAASLTPGTFIFGKPTGLVNINDQAEFAFLTTAPPTGTVGITGNASIGGGGIASIGPGVATVPEVGALSLLGVGLVPLALLARRRKS